MGDPVIDRTMAVRIATQLGWEPKREWVGLTDAEREEATGWSVEHIEAKLKEKNSAT